MNFLDLIEERWPGASEKDAEALLWITPFPFVPLEKIIASLDEMKNKWGTDIKEVINGAMKEFDEEFEKSKKISSIVEYDEEPPNKHSWDDSGERCVKCGDKDWMSTKCSK